MQYFTVVKLLGKYSSVRIAQFKNCVRLVCFLDVSILFNDSYSVCLLVDFFLCVILIE